MSRLENAVALITGGASGLGRGIAERFVEEGAAVVITDLNEAGSAVADTLGCTYLRQDVAEEADWEQAIAEVFSRHERIDVLVNNAG
ncbi:MAG: SDR family NAD(P)-dependent oxidoreductase, partial [Pseudomonadota bacterium]